jgi:hypothetical protein
MNFREIVLGSCGLDKSGLGYWRVVGSRVP